MQLLKKAIVLLLVTALAFPSGYATAAFKSGGGSFKSGGGGGAFKSGGGGSSFGGSSKPFKGFNNPAPAPKAQSSGGGGFFKSAPTSSPPSQFKSGGGTQPQKPSAFISGGRSNDSASKSVFSSGGGSDTKPKGFNPSASAPPRIDPIKQDAYAIYQNRRAAAEAFNARKDNVKAARRDPVIKEYTAPSSGSNRTTPSFTRRRVHETRTFYYRDRPEFRERYDRFGGWWDDCFGCNFGGYNPGFLMTMAMSDDPEQAALWYSLSGNGWFALWMSKAREKANKESDSAVIARLDRIEMQIQQRRTEGAVAVPTSVALQQMNVPPEVALSTDTLTGEVDEPDVERGGSWILLFVLLLMIGGGAAAFYVFVLRSPEREPNPYT